MTDNGTHRTMDLDDAPNDSRTLGDTSLDDNNDDDHVTANGTNRTKNDQKLTDFNVKWIVPPTDGLDQGKHLLSTVLLTLLEQFPKTVTIIDSNCREWTRIEAEDHGKWKDDFLANVGLTMHRLSPRRGKTTTPPRWTSILLIRSTTGIYEWKRDGAFRAALRDTRIYLLDHSFDLKEWDIVDIGFMKEIHVLHFPIRQLNNLIDTMLEPPLTNHPMFQFVPKKVIGTNKQMADAYVVQCPRANAAAVESSLTTGQFRQPDRNYFVPFKWKRTKSETFDECIRLQRQMYQETWVIKLEGLTVPMMETIQQPIREMSGVKWLLPSKRNPWGGEWTIQVAKNTVAMTFQDLQENWNDLLSQIPNELVKAAPANWISPCITSRSIRAAQDDDDSTDSYASLVTVGSAYSVAEAQSAPPASATSSTTPSRKLTYSAVVNNGKTASPTSTITPEMSSGCPHLPAVTNPMDKQTWEQERKKLVDETTLQIQRQQEQYQQDLEALKEAIDNKIAKQTDLEEKLADSINQNMHLAAQIRVLMAQMSALTHLPPSLSPLPPANPMDVDEPESSLLAVHRGTVLHRLPPPAPNPSAKRVRSSEPSTAEPTATTTVTYPIFNGRGRGRGRSSPTSRSNYHSPATPSQPWDWPQSLAQGASAARSSDDADASANYHHNILVNANDSFGDELDEERSPEHLRIYFQNINGLKWDKNGGNWNQICTMSGAINADIIALAELNHDTNRYAVRNKLEQVTKKHFDIHRFAAAASPLRTRSTYKPGGTALLTTGSLVGFIKQTMRDRMGRWTAMRYSGKQGTNVTVISAYQVCEGKVRAGSITASNQQQAQITLESLRQETNSRVAPRNAFIRDLQSFILELQGKGDDIILLGDFNEDMASETSGIARLAQECQLVDVFQEKFHCNETPATFQKGPRRIDFALVSRRVSPLVRFAGYDPFGYRLPSDHRGFFLDLDMQALLHSVPTPLCPLSQRDFNTRQPGVIVDYVRAKVKYLDDHNFSARLQQLQDLVAPDHFLAEALDRDMTRASEHAAKQCAKRKSTPWSPKFAEAWAHLHYFKIAKSAALNSVDYTAALNKLRTKWKNLPDDIPTRLSAIHSGYKKAQAKLREARSEAQAYRDDYLAAKSALYAALGDQGKQWVVDRLKRAEEMSRVHSKIEYLRRDDTSSGLSELKVPVDRTIIDPDTMKRLPDTPEYWETIRVPEEIESMLLERNRRHFGQAEGTPFTLPQVTAAVNYKGTGIAAEMMLDGEAEISNATEATRLFVNHLQRKTIVELPAEITEEEFLGKLKTWPEKTSTSPSGLHLGHYHAAWRDCGLAGDNPIRQEVTTGQTFLRRIHVALLNYSLKFGYSFDRWSHVVNVMLQKDPGNPRIHRLRVIHLYEADYNLLLAVKWRQAMHHAEDHHLLNEGLYGSRSGRSAHDPVFIEVLQHEIYKWSMKLGINFDLDATSCYDRILACLAAICSQRVGMAKSVIMVNATTLEEAKFKIKTRLGVSEAWYQHCRIFPIHGTGQGSGNSPQIWCFVCSVLFDAFAAKAHGATFCSYDRTRQLQLFMVGFVDDCSQRINVFDAHPQPSVHHLVELMTRDAQLWNDLLWTSGGALEQSKCSFHCVDFRWTGAGEPFHRPSNFAPPVILRHNGITTSIHQMSNYHSHKTLGCYVNPAGSATAQLKVLKRKNEEFARLLESNYFTPHEARTMYWSIYIPSMMYPLSVIPLPESECDALDKRFMKAIVPRCGYGRTMHRAIRYGPYALGGSTFKRSYVEMGALLLQMAMKFFNHPDTQPGTQLYIALSWFQAFLGVSFSVLEFPTRPIPPCDMSLFTVLQQFLASIEGKIMLRTPHVPTILRIHDQHLMDVALSNKQWKPIHLRHIQACRRYLQVQTIADVTDMDGTHLRGVMLDPSRPPQPTDVRVSMFNQPNPDPVSWQIWRSFLRTFSNIRGELHEPLGDWVVPLDQCRHWPQWAYNSSEDRLFRHVTNARYRPLPRVSKQRFEYTHTGSTEDITKESLPIRVSIRNDDLLAPILASGQRTPEAPAPAVATFAEFVLGLPQWEQELLRECQLLLSPREIMNFLNQDKGGVCGSDGSVKLLAATFGFVLAHSATRTLLAKGRGPAPGAKPNSFRSESYGVLAVLRFIIRLIEFTAVPLTVAPIIYLDNTSVVKRSNRATTQRYTVPNNYLLSEWDVIQSIADSSHQLPFPFEIRWVKGHQDEHKPRRSLPFPAQLNCLADDEATAAAQHLIAPPIPPLLPPVHALLTLGGESVTSKLKKRVHYAANAPALFDYLEKRFNWSPTTRQTIDFDMFAQINKAFQDKRPTLVKHCHAIAPTGHIAHRNNQSYPRCCPVCPCTDETNNHILQCPGPSRTQWRTDTINAIQKYRPLQSDPAIIRLLCSGLEYFHQCLPGSPAADSIHLPTSYRQLQIEQDSIGWDQVYRGRWSSQWELMHNQHSANQPPHLQQSGSKWVLGLGRLLLTQWFKLWKIRNDERHGVDAATRESARLQVVQHQLAALYSLRTKVCPCDRHIFLATPETHLQQFQDLQTIEDWITLYSEVIHVSVARAKALRIGNTPAIDEALRQLTPSSADAL